MSQRATTRGRLQFVGGTEYRPKELKFKRTDFVKALKLIGKHHK